MRRALYVWHRRLGIASAAFVAVLAVTGLALNHTDGLGLDSRRMDVPWLLAWYGIDPGPPPVSFAAGPHWLSAADGRLYLDGTPVAERVPRLIGAVALDATIMAATPDTFMLLAADGTLIESALAVGLPGETKALASLDGNAFAVRTDQGWFAGDADMVEWRPVEAPPARARAKAGGPPQAVAAAIARHRVGGGQTWERVLLDIHSGRILGGAGPWAMDLAAGVLVLLVATGLINWSRRPIRPAQRQGRRQS